MKSREEIERRLEAMEKSPVDFETRTIIDYLKAMKDMDDEMWLSHLVRKYDFNIKEDKAILKALRWLVDDDNDDL